MFFIYTSFPFILPSFPIQSVYDKYILIFRYWQCFSPVWRKKNNNGIFSASVEEISDSDSQFSFSNEESSSMHVNIISTKRSIRIVTFYTKEISLG